MGVVRGSLSDWVASEQRPEEIGCAHLQKRSVWPEETACAKALGYSMLGTCGEWQGLGAGGWAWAVTLRATGDIKGLE